MSGCIAERYDNVKIYIGRQGRSGKGGRPGRPPRTYRRPRSSPNNPRRTGRSLDLGELATAVQTAPCYGAQRLGYTLETGPYALHAAPRSGHRVIRSSCSAFICRATWLRRLQSQGLACALKGMNGEAVRRREGRHKPRFLQKEGLRGLWSRHSSHLHPRRRAISKRVLRKQRRQKGWSAVAYSMTDSGANNRLSIGTVMGSADSNSAEGLLSNDRVGLNCWVRLSRN